MPLVEATVTIDAGPADVFDLFVQPARLVELSPPGMQLQLVSGPARLEAGAETAWRVTRSSLRQSFTFRVTDLIPGRLIVLEQTSGPLRRMTRTQTFTAVGDATTLAERIEFEPPAGFLGRIVGEATVRAELEAGLRYRDGKLRELFPGGPT